MHPKQTKPDAVSQQTQKWYAGQPRLVKDVLQMCNQVHQNEQGEAQYSGLIPMTQTVLAHCQAVAELDKDNALIKDLSGLLGNFQNQYNNIIAIHSGGANGNSSSRDSGRTGKTGGRANARRPIKPKG